MKRFFLIALFGLSGLFTQNSLAQTRVSDTQRQLVYFEKVEQGIFNLPFEFSHIQNVIIPEIHAQRATLAPNFPETEELERNQSVIDAAYISWIENHPTEHLAYLKYLIQYTEDHK